RRGGQGRRRPGDRARQRRAPDPRGADRPQGRGSPGRLHARGPDRRGGQPGARRRQGPRGGDDEQDHRRSEGPGPDVLGSGGFLKPDPITRLTTELAKLPGIGEKTAQRLAYHILQSKPEYARGLAEALVDVVENVRLCSVCCTLTDQDPCAICSDPRRDPSLLCVVENVPDLLAVERSREYRGRYHVLHGAISPLDGVGPDRLRIRELLRRLEGGEP